MHFRKKIVIRVNYSNIPVLFSKENLQHFLLPENTINLFKTERCDTRLERLKNIRIRDEMESPIQNDSNRLSDLCETSSSCIRLFSKEWAALKVMDDVLKNQKNNNNMSLLRI